MSNSIQGQSGSLDGCASPGCDYGRMSSPQPSDDLRAVAREVEDFVSGGGWDQVPQLFALVPTIDLVARQPELADSLDQNTTITPVAQDTLPEGDLAETLAGIMWPEAVHGCALA